MARLKELGRRMAEAVLENWCAEHQAWRGPGHDGPPCFPLKRAIQ